MKRYFVSDASNQTDYIESQDKESGYPLSIVQQPPLNGSKVALWVWLQSNMINESNIDYAFSHNGYTHYRSKIYTSENGDSESQTINIFEDYCNFLKKQDISIANNCIRTWLFVQNVDANYQGVVDGRKCNFNQNGLTEQTHYIASTGIEGRNKNLLSLVSLETYAIKGLDSRQQKFLHAPENMNPTHEYGVTFEIGRAHV